ncbi:hypothetical protein [Candidatus Halocynthiibacter alkanivorans]|uniref:hypothetical protein n=1 Tax=Candidatus Halocynthiibacter alkanivorans TaxID=2267619 RepID=UPI000DF1EF60|nr:hypothetical protein [Candidatus Halocynthiibacter alkanivorans]
MGPKTGMVQRNFLDLLAPAEIFYRVEPMDDVIQGDVDETLTLPAPRMAWARAQIELHQDCEPGRWMWATSHHLAVSGGGYRVGPKWGKFTNDLRAALAGTKRSRYASLPIKRNWAPGPVAARQMPP